MMEFFDGVFTEKPALERSEIRGEYLSVLMILDVSILSSQGTVSSMMVMWDFSPLLMMTMSGFSEVTRMSGGMVPPPMVCPSMSAYTSTRSLSINLKLI